MPKFQKSTDHNAMVMADLDSGMRLKGQLWIECGDQTYLSLGRLVLLERIESFGSVSAAAKSMNMSFSHAWHLVEEMNTLAPEPLVGKQTGGSQGGGAWLTDAGKSLVVDFRALINRFQKWIADEQLYPNTVAVGRSKKIPHL